MASNASGQSAYNLGPSVRVDRGARPFSPGELVLIRIPEEIWVEGHVENEATAIGTDLPPISTGSGPQHFVFIREVYMNLDILTLEVYPVLSFTNTGGALSTYDRIDDATAKAALLPLPPLSSLHPTPNAFGEPLDFGNWSTPGPKYSFLHIFPRRLTFPMRRSFKRMDPPLLMPFLVMLRIDRYRKYLLSTTSTPHGQTGDGGGQVASGVASVTSSPTLISDGGGEKAAGVGLEEFPVKSTYGLLVAEDVDEDAQDGDATTRQELMMLAYDNPVWMGELRRYLQEEEKEKEQMQKERLARLASWREDIAI